MAPTPDQVAGAIRSIVVDAAVKVAIQRGMTLLPAFMVWGPIGALVSWIATHFIHQFLDHMQEEAIQEFIGLKDQMSKRDWSKKQLALRMIAAQHGIESKEFKDAHAKEKEAFNKLVHYASGARAPGK